MNLACGLPLVLTVHTLCNMHLMEKASQFSAVTSASVFSLTKLHVRTCKLELKTAWQLLNFPSFHGFLSSHCLLHRLYLTAFW